MSAEQPPPRRRRFRPREILFLLAGGVILYHEVWVSAHAQSLLVFAALFLWGLIPVGRLGSSGVSLADVMKAALREWLEDTKGAPPPPPPPPGKDDQA